MSLKKPFKFSRAHQVGYTPVIRNRVVETKVPLKARNFYLDCPIPILKNVFQNSSKKQLDAHFKAIKELVLNYDFNPNKRRLLVKMLVYLRDLGGG